MRRVQSIATLLLMLVTLGLGGTALAASEHGGESASNGDEHAGDEAHSDEKSDKEKSGDEHAGDEAHSDDHSGDEHAGDEAE